MAIASINPTTGETLRSFDAHTAAEIEARVALAQETFRAAVRQLISRKNSVNGRSYNADPTIMYWQLANEPRPGSDANSRPHHAAFTKWLDDTAGVMKKLAPKHLVSTGYEGWMGTGGSRELFVSSHAT